MGTEWQLQEAKNRLSQLISQTIKEGPQTITVRGKPTVIVFSIEQYQRLISNKTKLSKFLAESPLAEEDLDLKRDTDLARDVEI